MLAHSLDMTSLVTKPRVAFVTAVALLALSACSPKTADKAPAEATTAATPTASEVIVAKVNGTPIMRKEVDMVLKQQRGMADTPETRKMIIDNLAMQMVVAQEAIKKGFDKTADTLTELEMAKQSILAQAYVHDFIKTNEVTDAQLTAEYEKLKAQISGNEYKARHILVKTDDEAKAIIAKLNKNANAFNDLAKKQSLDPGSKTKGGDLGWFDPKSMVPEFAGAVAKLDKGKFTETPVKSQFGYHVIMLDDIRPNTASIPPLEQVKAGLTQQLQQKNLKAMLDGMKAKATIEIMAAAPAPAAASAPAAVATPEASAPPAPATDASASAPATTSNKPAK